MPRTKKVKKTEDSQSPKPVQAVLLTLEGRDRLITFLSSLQFGMGSLNAHVECERIIKNLSEAKVTTVHDMPNPKPQASSNNGQAPPIPIQNDRGIRT